MEYARAGSQTLILQGRNVERLHELAASCTTHGARVITQALDVRDHAALLTWLSNVSRTESPDLVIANAGVKARRGMTCTVCSTSTSKPSWQRCTACCQPCAHAIADRSP